MFNKVPDYCLGCTLYRQDINLESIIEKWENEIDSIERSGMSESDDPYFAIKKIRECIKDLKGDKP